jgi:hypothetical protein
MIPNYEELVASLPPEILSDKIREDLSNKYNKELISIDFYEKKAKEPQSHMSLFRKSGSQYIAEFFVNDLSKTVGNSFNWHLQNTSQWLYAGCILVADGEVSTHH